MHAALPIDFITISQTALLRPMAVRLIAACAMGSVTGMERERRGSASGLRTNILICVGAAMFTMLSAVIAGDGSPNRGQIASNIVQGIGFLGAGLILHTRNRVLGLTSAATVWVVAAIGMACGAGLYLAAGILTAIVFVNLRYVSVLATGSKRYPMLYEVRGSDEKAMFKDILCALDKVHIRLNIVERDTLGEIQRVTFTVTGNRAWHRELLAELIACDSTDQVSSFCDEDTD
jgi:putative Mg2+ transporter-C (MgtC) family protein